MYLILLFSLLRPPVAVDRVIQYVQEMCGIIYRKRVCAVSFAETLLKYYQNRIAALFGVIQCGDVARVEINYGAIFTRFILVVLNSAEIVEIIRVV